MKKGSFPTILTFILIVALAASILTFLIVGSTRITQGPQTCESVDIREDICYSSIDQFLDVSLSNRGGVSIDEVTFISDTDEIQLPQSSISRGSSYQVRIPLDELPEFVGFKPYVNEEECNPIEASDIPFC